VLQFHTISVAEVVFVPAAGGVGTPVFTVTVVLAVALHPASLVTVTV
jgi:hypothetical protein